MILPAIILASPQMGENIGAAARVMHNFGLDDLRLVNPRDGWPNEKAAAMARGAGEVIKSARIFSSLPEAMADCQRVYATSPREHNLALPTLDARAAAEQMAKSAAEIKSAIIFGCEQHGLANDEIALADAIIAIPTAEYSSLNLAQAVAVCAYEWWHESSFPRKRESTTEKQQMDPRLRVDDELVAPKAEFEAMYQHLEAELEIRGYFRNSGIKANMSNNLRTMLTKTNWSTQEIKSFRGIISSLTRAPKSH